MKLAAEHNQDSNSYENIHHGRYNEPGLDGKDIYQINKKAKEHMRQLKNQK